MAWEKTPRCTARVCQLVWVAPCVGLASFPSQERNAKIKREVKKGVPYQLLNTSIREDTGRDKLKDNTDPVYLCSKCCY